MVRLSALAFVVLRLRLVDCLAVMCLPLMAAFHLWVVGLMFRRVVVCRLLVVQWAVVRLWAAQKSRSSLARRPFAAAVRKGPRLKRYVARRQKACPFRLN